jgi:uncharacterized membrane protein
MTTQRLISRIAIWILAIVMIRFGIYHFEEPRRLLEYVPGNLPGGINSVYVVGAAYILAAIAFVTNKFVKIVGYLLAVLLVASVLMIHLPIYREAGMADTRQMALIAMLKDTAIAAFALHIAGSADSHGVKY